MHNQSYASYKDNITTLKYIGKNWDNTEMIYKCKSRVNDKRIKGALLIVF